MLNRPEQVTEALSKLGYYHALTNAFISERKPDFSSFSGEYPTSSDWELGDKEGFGKWLEKMEGLFLEDLKGSEMESERERLKGCSLKGKHLKNRSEIALTFYVRTYTNSACRRYKTAFLDEMSKCPVLAHGDFWSNNVMFSSSEDGSVQFIDWQFFRRSQVWEDFPLMALSELKLYTDWGHLELVL